MPTLTIPNPALVLLIGPAGAGKSTFAAHHFHPTEIISSDRCRALICDDESAQHINAETFGLVQHLARLRLQQRKLTVIDATNLQYSARRPLLRLARRFNVPTVAIVFNVSLAICQSHNRQRTTRVVPEEVLRTHSKALAHALTRLAGEGYAQLYTLNQDELGTARFGRTKNDLLN